MARAAESRRRTRLSPSRADILFHLRAQAEPCTIVAVAEGMGVHPNTARFHLDGLVQTGLATRERERRAQRGRPRLLYAATPAAPDPEVLYQNLAGALVAHLELIGDQSDDQIEQAGRHWGTRLAQAHRDDDPVDRVVTTLTGLGYQPRTVGEPVEAIEMTPCPFQAMITPPTEPGELAPICRLHLGLIRGLLSDLPGGDDAELESWATPTTCIAYMPRPAQG
jgi:predicted ArsR family transcriptional regulator